MIAHSPPYGIYDGDDQAHRGFKTFLRMMACFRPRYLLHGHQHVHALETRKTRYANTEVINVYPWQVIEW